MEAKSLLIPIAAFALSATGVSAFNSDILQKAGLSSEQIQAFEEAHELRREGDPQKARQVLVKAGIDLETMESVREAMRAYRQELHTAIDAAIQNNAFEAFKEAIKESPLSDIITTQADFELFAEAHNLHKAGEHEEARAITDSLGLDDVHDNAHAGHMRHFMGRHGGSFAH